MATVTGREDAGHITSSFVALHRRFPVDGIRSRRRETRRA